MLYHFCRIERFSIHPFVIIVPKRALSFCDISAIESLRAHDDCSANAAITSACHTFDSAVTYLTDALTTKGLMSTWDFGLWSPWCSWERESLLREREYLSKDSQSPGNWPLD